MRRDVIAVTQMLWLGQARQPPRSSVRETAQRFLPNLACPDLPCCVLSISIIDHWGQSASWRRRTRQSTPILERVVSRVTITDPHHFLFGHRLEVLNERWGRGPAYVVVALPDGRRRAVRIS